MLLFKIELTLKININYPYVLYTLAHIYNKSTPFSLNVKDYLHKYLSRRPRVTSLTLRSCNAIVTANKEKVNKKI